MNKEMIEEDIRVDQDLYPSEEIQSEIVDTVSDTEQEYVDETPIDKYNPSNKKPEKILTPKQKAFLTHLGGDAKGNIREAMTMAGYSANTQPSEVFSHITDEIVKVANNLMSANAVKAVVGLLDVLDKPTKPGNKDVIAAAKELLDRAGLLKKQEGSGNVNVQGDVIFILPAKDGIDSSRFVR